jgi:hypothetical protein
LPGMPRNVLENVSPYRKNTMLCGFRPSGNTRSALTNGFSQRTPRALSYGWKDTGELAVMWLYRMASLSALLGLKTGTLQAG